MTLSKQQTYKTTSPITDAVGINAHKVYRGHIGRALSFHCKLSTGRTRGSHKINRHYCEFNKTNDGCNVFFFFFEDNVKMR